jgi:hypothetical protein
MKRLIRLVLAISTALAGAGCFYPVDIKPECRERVNGCLARCGGDGGAIRPVPAIESMPADTRSQCERSCHSLCP